jgi:hypothetical protein
MSAEEHSRLWRGVLDDGTEVLVTAWPHSDGRDVLELALRHDGERTWGPPLRMIEQPS